MRMHAAMHAHISAIVGYVRLTSLLRDFVKKVRESPERSPIDFSIFSSPK